MNADRRNRAKFDRLFGDHYDAISRYCHRRLSTDDANEATAEVFVVLWRKIDDAPPESEALPWLYAVARNEVSRFWRTNRRRGALVDKMQQQPQITDTSIESVVIQHTDHAEILRALASLRPADQEVLRLRAYEHLTLPEVAVVLGCSVEAAKKRASRAMRRLRKQARFAETTTDDDQSSRATGRGGEG